MEIKDKYVAGALLGAMAPLAGFAVTWLLVRLGIGSYDIFQLDSIIVTLNRPNRIVGLIVNVYAGALTGFLLIWLLERFGSRFIVFKAVGLTSLAWFVVEAFVTAFCEGRYLDIRPIGDYYVYVIGATAVGLVLGALVKLVIYRDRGDPADTEHPRKKPDGLT